jgi:uncharacterized metal-binding protein YceD (DUF177 family)
MQLKYLRIPVRSTSSEVQEYDFEIDDSFFANFEYGEIEKGKLKVLVKGLFSNHQIQLDMRIEGVVEVACDRCLDNLKINLNSLYTLYGKFGHGTDQEDLDVIWIPDDKHYIDMVPVLYEYINLSLPLKKIHPDNEDGISLCNEEMISRLDEFNVNQED